MTGDLSIINNAELRTLIFRENQPPDKQCVYYLYKGALDSYIDKMSSRLSLPKVMFSEWKIKLLNDIQKEINTLHSYKFNNILSKKSNTDDLKKLQEHFIFTPVDKASNNVCIVCKKFYYDTLHNEVINSGNFEFVDDNESDTLNNINTYLKHNKLSQHLKVKNKLPYLYWTAKMHKNPPSFRFITSGRDTITSSLSEVVGLCFKSMLKIDRSTSKYRHKYKDYHDFFIADNRDDVLEHMRVANGCGTKNKSIKTYDFTSLYTNIPHDKLKNNISKFIKRIFNIKGKKFINISGKNAYFAQKRSNKIISFTVAELIKHVNFIIDNSYILFNGRLYRQTIGIPMGTSCAPHIANIFLHVYEYEFIDSLIEAGDIAKAVKLKYLFRYQDDCIVFEDRDGGEHFFEINISNIYPEEMELKPTNLSKNTCTYLDLYISIYQGDYNFRSYDKRNDFGFMVINYPYLNSTIPTQPSDYGVFIS